MEDAGDWREIRENPGWGHVVGAGEEKIGIFSLVQPLVIFCRNFKVNLLQGWRKGDVREGAG